MKQLVILGMVLATGLSQAAEIYSNGPVVDANHLSMVAPGSGTYGYNASTVSNVLVAEDFTVAAGQKWTVSSLDFFAYQTNATSFPLLSATWSIRSGDAGEGLLVASGITALSDGGREGYRVQSILPSNTQRAIYRGEADIADISLASGHYWLSWSLSGNSALGGPWIAPTSDGVAGNAIQRSGNAAFASLGVELPFAINGTVSAVPEPETYAMLLAGLLAVGAVARRRKAS